MKTIFISLFIISSSIIAQSLSDYYPLQIGNKWLYKVTEYNTNSTPSISYHLKEIVGDTIMGNGQKYFSILESGSISFERFDTVTNEIRYYNLSGCPGNDIARYSLNYVADSTVTWKSCNSLTYNIKFEKSENSDTSFINLAGYGIITELLSFKKYVGIIYHIYSEVGYSTYNLIGTRLNGKECGQLTDVRDIYEITSDYNLEQNYPNPFNPTTEISYSMQNDNYVKLVVYNIVGEEIAVLVNKFQIRGNYSVEFNAANLSSGFYLYKIQVGNSYHAARKMIYLK